MMWVLTIPSAAADGDAVERLPAADVADARRDSDAAIGIGECVVAAAKPIRAETRTDLEKYMFADV